MNLILENFLFIFLGLISAGPVILVKQYTVAPFNFFLLVLALVVYYSLVVSFYYYFLSNKIALTGFYPIVKLIEMFVPVLIGIFYYNHNLKLINYVGLFCAILAIIFIEQ
jgi:multidrug transporter EmrE-like cation transporter